MKLVNNVNTIIGPSLIGRNPTDQTTLDNLMVHALDGTQKLDGGATLNLSLAVCKAGSYVRSILLYRHIPELDGNTKLVLPIPAFNTISCAEDKNEYMILPVGGASFKEAMKMGGKVYQHLKDVIKERYGFANVGDEGGFVPNIQGNKEGLELLKTSIEKAGYTRKVVIGMDISIAFEYYKSYDLNSSKKRTSIMDHKQRY